MLSDPQDPFGPNEETTADFTAFAVNCRSMHTALIEVGFKSDEALEFTMYVMTELFIKAAKT